MTILTKREALLRRLHDVGIGFLLGAVVVLLGVVLVIR